MNNNTSSLSISLQNLTPTQKYIVSFFVFIIAGIVEISGGWLVWQTLRHGKNSYFAFIGSILLVSYGFLAALNPFPDFGRTYAIYGGYFIVLSLLFGKIVDGFQPDVGDYVGGSVVVIGKCK